MCETWDSYQAEFYKKDGKIDFKAECDGLFNHWGVFKVEKSCMRGNVYYAAIRHIGEDSGNEDENGYPVVSPLPENEQKVLGYVVECSQCENEFLSMTICEYQYPKYFTNCPVEILNLLSETQDENALRWRKECREYQENKRKINIRVYTERIMDSVKELMNGQCVDSEGMDQSDSVYAVRDLVETVLTEFAEQVDPEQKYNLVTEE